MNEVNQYQVSESKKEICIEDILFQVILIRHQDNITDYPKLCMGIKMHVVIWLIS